MPTPDLPRPAARTPRARPRLAAFAIAIAVAACACACGGANETSAPTDEPVDERVVRLNNVGTSRLGRQEWSEAEQAFRRALETAPDDPVLHNNVAVALLQQGRTEEAEAELRSALELDPAHPYANFNLGLVHKSRGELEEAVACFERVRAHDDRDVFTRFHLGSSLSRLGRDERAEAELRRALELDPNHVSSLYALGRHLIAAGRSDEGATLVRRSQEIRTRAGLDAAVGNQYGEQGPYALGAHHPSGGLRAPDPTPLALTPTALAATSPSEGAAALAVHRSGRDAALAVALADRNGLRALEGPPTSGAAPAFTPLALAAGSRVLDVASGDLDGDGADEIVVLVVRDSPGGHDVAVAVASPHGREDARSVTGLSEPLGAAPENGALALVDRDHDGDLDLFACWGGSLPAGCALGTNDGSARFAAAGETVGLTLEADATPVDVTFGDVDDDRDVDLLVATERGVTLFDNRRDGTFENASDASGLSALFDAPETIGRIGSIEPADVDGDRFVELVLGTSRGPYVVRNRRGAFVALDAIDPERSATPEPSDPTVRPSAVVVDLDLDGFRDVVYGTGDGTLRIARHRGLDGWRTAALELEGARALVAFDADRDGDLDLLATATGTSAGATLLRNDTEGAGRSITVDLEGVRDNRFGVGAKVEVLAGALRLKLEKRSSLPLVVGLGRRERVDAVRLLWPGGVLQDEIDLPAGEPVRITQLDRKGTSCPLLYTWRDGRWNFVTDLLGGVAIGYRHGPDTFGIPDTDEYVLLEGGLDEVDGRFRVRLNNQLEEVIWFDAAELLVVDHPRGTEVYPNESLMPAPPYRPHALYVSSDVRAIARASVPTRARTGAAELEAADAARAFDAPFGADAEDVTDRLAARDRRYVEGFELLPFKGYAELHALDLDLGDVPTTEGRVVLLLDGWIDYADSSANVAAHQAGVTLVPPRLFVETEDGALREVEGVMGFPAGLPKTMSVDLTGALAHGSGRVRIVTSMRIYWDRARVLVGGTSTPFEVVHVPVERAELRFGGYPKAVSPDGRKPRAYDPYDVEPTAPWKLHAGRYTAFGPVEDRLRAVDDWFVTTRHGDEIELAFRSPGPVPEGHDRTFLLFADGFGKDMDPNSAASSDVGPVPFHGMGGYPYGEGEGVPVPQRSTRQGDASIALDTRESR